jgi:hypothetical protein
MGNTIPEEDMTAIVGAEMSSTITKVIAIRVKNETYEFFRGKPLNRIVENVHEMYERKELGITSDGKVYVSSHNTECKDY